MHKIILFLEVNKHQQRRIFKVTYVTQNYSSDALLSIVVNDNSDSMYVNFDCLQNLTIHRR